MSRPSACSSTLHILNGHLARARRYFPPRAAGQSRLWAPNTERRCHVATRPSVRNPSRRETAAPEFPCPPRLRCPSVVLDLLLETTRETVRDDRKLCQPVSDADSPLVSASGMLKVRPHYGCTGASCVQYDRLLDIPIPRILPLRDERPVQRHHRSLAQRTTARDQLV